MPLETDVAYRCPYCSEQNFLGVDPTGGSPQRFIEDCPVCCNPIAFTLRVDRDGDVVLQSVEVDA
ncbi:MAG: CPXCG motif-containing cysteine-rich protein [Candidatus Baltobacteraceae bacterium]